MSNKMDWNSVSRVCLNYNVERRNIVKKRRIKGSLMAHEHARQQYFCRFKNIWGYEADNQLKQSMQSYRHLS